HLFMCPRAPGLPHFPYTTLFRSDVGFVGDDGVHVDGQCGAVPHALVGTGLIGTDDTVTGNVCVAVPAGAPGLWTLSLEGYQPWRSAEHTSELHSRENIVCRLQLE